MIKQLQIDTQQLIVQNLDIQPYKCLICLQLAKNPVKCTICNSIFCLTCASNWKSSNNQCPKRCQKPWIFQKYTNCIPIKVKCPFTNQCPIMRIQDLQNHIYSCKQIPKNLMEIIDKINGYKCKNNHQLEFWIGSYYQMINSICDDCGQKMNCRSKCQICDTKYCVVCRAPKCTKQKCPKGHKFQFKNVTSSYICDICGLRPANFSQGVYNDDECNFGICQSCHKKLSEKKRRITQNIQDKKPIQIIDKINEYKCKNNHQLEFWIGSYYQMINSICDVCEQKIVCRSKCQTCNKKYCVVCRPPKCTKQKCPKGHKFSFQNVSSSYICDICGLKPADLKQGAYTDEICNFGICQSCHKKLQFESLKQKYQKNNQLCKNNHLLKYLQNLKKQICQGCNKEKTIIRFCQQCNQNFCIDCKPLIINKFGKCTNEHKLTIQQKANKQVCLICEKKNNIYYKDNICKFIICQNCYTELKKKQILKQKKQLKKCINCMSCEFERIQQSLKSCINCLNIRICKIRCKLCGEFMCGSCQPDQIKCQKHIFKQIKQQQESICNKCEQLIQKIGYICNVCEQINCSQCYEQKN